MRSMKNDFLAATAALALIAASGSAFAQAAESGVKKETTSSGSTTQMKTQSGATTDTKPGTTSTQMRTQGEATTDAKPGTTDTQTRTQAQEPSADQPAQLSESQRMQIGTSVRSERNLRRVERSSINFNINVGTAIPRSMNLAPLPGSVLTLVPAYRGYLYIVVGDDLLIVHPRTYEIVAVIPA